MKRDEIIKKFNEKELSMVKLESRIKNCYRVINEMDIHESKDLLVSLEKYSGLCEICVVSCQKESNIINFSLMFYWETNTDETMFASLTLKGNTIKPTSKENFYLVAHIVDGDLVGHNFCSSKGLSLFLSEMPSVSWRMI